MKILTGIIVFIIGAALFVGVSDFPHWGDPSSPASTRVSPYYLDHALPDAHVPNVVTAVLADYRSLDTMMETGVVFIACMAIMFMLRRPRPKRGRAFVAGDKSLIVRHASRMMIPMMQLFALYVIAHGHYSPGGGFQGGVILGASLILLALSFDLKTAFSKLTERSTVILSALGVLIFSGIGTVSLFYGEHFLNYGFLSHLLPSTDIVMAHSHGILFVEIGVAIAVMTAMFSIYADLASNGKLDKGL